MMAMLLCATSALVAKQPANIQPVLKLRGGLAGLDPNTVATYASYLSLANSGVMTLAGEKAAELYGIENPSPLAIQLAEWAGGTMLAMAITSLLALGGMDFATAVAWGSVALLIQNVQGLLKDTASKLGFGTAAKYMPVAIAAALTAALFGKISAIDTGLALKIVTVWDLVNGLGAYFATTPFFNAWEGPSMSEVETAMAKFFGGTLTLAGVFCGSVAFLNKDVLTAIGYTWAVSTAINIDALFITKNMDAMGADKNSGYVWTAIGALIVAAILA